MFEDQPADFMQVIVVIVIFFLSTRLLNAGPSHIFGLLLAWLVVKNLRQTDNSENVSLNDTWDQRNVVIGSPSNFYIEPNLIDLFFILHTWKPKNPINFDRAVKAVNIVLQTEIDSDKPLRECVSNYEVAVDQSRDALNLVHGFIYSVDQPILIEKLQKILSRLQQLLERHLKKIKENCDKKSATETNVHTRYTDDAGAPGPIDPRMDPHFDLF
jgi:hypothetical protein